MPANIKKTDSEWNEIKFMMTGVSTNPARNIEEVLERQQVILNKMEQDFQAHAEKWYPILRQKMLEKQGK